MNTLVPVYNGVYYEANLKNDNDTNELTINLTNNYSSALPVKVYLIVSFSETRKFGMPFRKNNQILNDGVLETERQLVLWNSNTAQYKIHFSKPYVYISLVSAMSETISLDIHFHYTESMSNKYITIALFIILGFSLLMIIFLLICCIMLQKMKRMNSVQIHPDMINPQQQIRSQDLNKLTPEDYDRFFKPFDKKDLPEKNLKFLQETCLICLDQLDNDNQLRQISICQHIFHDKC